MRFLPLALLLNFPVTVCAAHQQRAPSGSTGMNQGAFTEKSVYVLVGEKVASDRARKWIVISNWAGKQIQKYDPIVDNGLPFNFSHLSVGHGSLWVTCLGWWPQWLPYLRRIPISDLDFYNEEKKTQRAKRILEKYPESKDFGCHTWYMGPLFHENSGIRRSIPLTDGFKNPAFLIPPQFYDFVPVGKTSGKLFHCSLHGLWVWDVKATWNKQKDSWDVDFGDVPKEIIGKKSWKYPPKPQFPGNFLAYIQGETYFFLTYRGELHMAKKTNRPYRPTEKFWIDKDRPITAVITDAEKNKVYFFGKDAKKKKLFWFEMSEQPQPHYFERKDLKPAHAPEPLKTVLEYARLLRAAQKKKQPASE